MKTKRIAGWIGGVALVVLMLGAGRAEAATILQTEEFSFVPSGSQVLTFNQFDESLGELTRVTISVDLSKSGGSFAADNDSESVVNITLDHTVSLSSLTNSLGGSSMTREDFSTIGDALSVQTSTPATLQATTGDDTNNFNATGGDDYISLNPVPGASNSESGDVNTSYNGLNLYKGTGNFTLTPEATQSFSLGGDGGAAFSGTAASASGSVSVEYEYTPDAVPEPPSFALVGVALLLIFILRRNRPEVSDCHSRRSVGKGDKSHFCLILKGK